VTTRIGVISDTHGWIRPQAIDALKGVDLILHAGDIGKPDVIAALKTLAPTRLVRGNNDRGRWAADLPERISMRIGGARILMLHDRKTLDFDPAQRGYQVVIAGHSHQPSITRISGVLYMNPGSAGPQRFRLPISVARLTVRGRQVRAKLRLLEIHHSGNAPTTKTQARTVRSTVGRKRGGLR
jgi:uncharacterized protein